MQITNMLRLQQLLYMCVWTYLYTTEIYRRKHRVHIDQIFAPLALATSWLFDVVWTIFRVPARQLCTTCVLDGICMYKVGPTSYK